MIKTALKSDGMKSFVNVCQSSEIDKPTKQTVRRKGTTGTNWSVPHSTSPHREDVDKAGKYCIVYDVVFHPDALRLADTNKQFKDMIVNTALNGIEQRFPEHKFDRDSLKYPKMEYKGNIKAQRSMIRTKKRDNSEPDQPAGEPAAGRPQFRSWGSSRIADRS